MRGSSCTKHGLSIAMSLPIHEAEIDPRGDFILRFSSESAEYHLRVSSKALCLASSVFRDMLDPPTVRGGQAVRSASFESPFKMDLKLDNYQALLIVLHAVHHQVRKIPKSLSLDEFYQLAILCNQYDLAEIFVSWVEVWKSKLGKVPGEKMAYGKWFVIAWVFRLSEAFEAVTREMIYDASLSSGFVAEGGGRVEIGSVPDWVFGNSTKPQSSYNG